MEEVANKFSSNVESMGSLLKPGDMIEVYGGPNASEAQFDSIHAANSESWRKNSPFQPHNLTANIVNKGNTFSPATLQYAGIAYVGDNDTGNTGLSAHMPGITIGPDQDVCSYFLLNGMTTGINVARYFLQVGQIYNSDRTCQHVYATDADGLHPHPMNLSYQPDHDYGYFIRYLNGSDSDSVWWLCAEDYSAGGDFDFYMQYHARGTSLTNDGNTSVWFENFNRNVGWNQYFPASISASMARRYTSSHQWVNWTSDIPGLIIGGLPYSASGVIYGHLAGNQTASWILNLVPRYQ
jgi:hypothetical protein